MAKPPDKRESSSLTSRFHKALSRRSDDARSADPKPALVPRAAAPQPAEASLSVDGRTGDPAKPADYVETPGWSALDAALSKVGRRLRDYIEGQISLERQERWYVDQQLYKARQEVNAVLCTDAALIALHGKRPMRAASGSGSGRPQLAPAGPWQLDVVELPFDDRPSVKFTDVPPGPETVSGGYIADRSIPDIEPYFQNLPAHFQDGVKLLIPTHLRLRARTFALGPTHAEPERVWLFVTSHDRLAYAYGERSRQADPSGLAAPLEDRQWKLHVLTASIGPARNHRVEI